MQELFDVGFACKEDYNSLKALWCEVFGDSAGVIEKFFNNTVQDENIICVKYGEKIVNSLYMLDAVISNNGRKYKSMYIYAVATDEAFRGKGLMKKAFSVLFQVAASKGVSYLFLVPESEGLFKMYEKQGFKVCFCYKENEIFKTDYPLYGDFEENEFTYLDYVKFRELYKKTPLATLSEKAFNSFYKPFGSDVKVIYIKNAGYCVVENIGENTVVYELFGDENVLFSAVFKLTECEKIILREPTETGGVPYGMAKIIDASPEIRNGFFGIPYGG